MQFSMIIIKATINQKFALFDKNIFKFCVYRKKLNKQYRKLIENLLQ